uniref:Ig-like domain-containing protein n=1 Tax=Cyprinodon variegatus TaxID=28743 RepID=A0A3Q2FS35_CYPVA
MLVELYMWDLFPVCTEEFKFEVRTIIPGENLTLACPHQSSVLYKETLYWIRLVSGKWPEFLGATFNFMADDVSKISHIQAKQDRGEFLLHINEAQQDDTGLYYCIKVRQMDFVFMKGTFVKIKGEISVVLQKPPSGPVQPELPEALQCSVLPNSERSTCPADNRVYWFRAGSDEPHPSLLYLQGNSLDECEKSSEAPSIQKCFYNFSETVDPGTYYCAVAACGQIIFGNGEKLNGMWKSFLNNNYDKNDILIYSAPTFKRNKDKKAERRIVKPTMEETVYTDVKTFR